MPIKLTSLKSNLVRERDGDWIAIPDLPGVELKVRGANYGPFQIALGQVEQRWARKYGRERVPADEMARENGRLYAEHIVLGWRGFDVEYSPEFAADALANPEFRTLQDHVRYAMDRVAAVHAEFVEEALGNSAAPSVGT